MRHVVKKEVPEAEMQKFLEGQRTSFDGLRYTVPVKLKGLVWNKPVAYVEYTTSAPPKYFIVTDL
jgi:hypothetical protein